jgi:salicylate hydroxylase
MAQGACLALEDAWVLAASLDDAGDMAGGLARYQALRESRARRVVAAATGNAWKYHLSFPPLRWAAHTALRAGGRLAPEAMIRQFDWIYRYDAIDAAARAGKAG